MAFCDIKDVELVVKRFEQVFLTVLIKLTHTKIQFLGHLSMFLLSLSKTRMSFFTRITRIHGSTTACMLSLYESEHTLDLITT